METTRKAPYSVYNDGTGPYAMFTCESCGRDYRAQPVLVEEVKETVAKSAFGGLLRTSRSSATPPPTRSTTTATGTR